MIVFDLRCSAGHVFESWFKSSTAYTEQRAAGLLSCPLCGTAEVEKAVMAPNVAAKGNRGATASTPPAAPAEMPSPAQVKAALAALARAQSKALASSEWVGTAFADRARAMHAGEEKEAPIHGQASLKEAKALAEEGVPIAPLPFPVIPPERQN